MSIVITCGFCDEYCETLQSQLLELGLNPPAATNSDEISPAGLATRFTVPKRSSRSRSTKQKPGAAWQNAATDIVLTNASRTPWGWAAPQNVKMLDFWQSFDPNTRFVIAFASPADAIARVTATENSFDPQFLEKQYKAWVRYYKAALDFYQRNSDVSLLVNFSAPQTYQSLPNLVSDRLDLPVGNKSLSLDAITDVIVGRNVSPLLRIIASTFVSSKSDGLELYQSLENAADIPSGSAETVLAEPQNALRELSNLVDKKALQDARDELANERENSQRSRNEAQRLQRIQLEELIPSLDAARREVQTLRHSDEEVKSSLNSANERIQTLETSLSSIRAEKTHLQDKFEGVKTELEQCRSSSENEISSLQSQLVSQHVDLEKEKANFEEATRALELSQNEAQRLQRIQLEELMPSLESARREIETLQQSIAEAKSLVKDAEARELKLETELSAAEAKNNELQSMLDNAKTQLEQSRKVAEDDVSSLQSQLVSQRTDLEQETKNFLEAQKALEISNGELKVAVEEGEHHKAELEAYKTAVQSLEERAALVTDLEGQIVALNEQVAEGQRVLEDTRSQLQSELDDARGNVENVTNHNQTLQDELADMHQQLERLRTETDGWIDVYNESQQNKEDIEHELQAAYQQADKLHAEVNTLNLELTHAHSANKTAFEQLHIALTQADKSDQVLNKTEELQGMVEQMIAQQQASDLSTKSEEHSSLLESRLEKALADNELLNLQLYQAQDELQRISRAQIAKTPTETASRRSTSTPRKTSPPAKAEIKSVTPASTQAVIDLRQFIEGHNWHNAEHDGRWAGPDKTSTIILPVMQPNTYMMKIEVVAAMSRDILDKLQLKLNGAVLPKTTTILSNLQGPLATARRLKANLTGVEHPYPAVVSSPIDLKDYNAERRPTLSLEFPRTLCPADMGENDTRRLALRIKKITLDPAS